MLESSLSFRIPNKAEENWAWMLSKSLLMACQYLASSCLTVTR